MVSHPSQIALGRPRGQLAGSWELGLLAMIGVLFAAGAAINPAFFASGDALHALLRDTARVAVMAVGMTFVIANRDLDLSVGSTLGLTAVVFSLAFDSHRLDLGIGAAIALAVAVGAAIGIANGVLVTLLRVPAFIATLTMLLVGRGIVLGLTGGRSILYSSKAATFPGFFQWGETNAWGFNNQIAIAIVCVAVGAVVLAKTRWGYETLATGGNEQAASYAGIPTPWVRIRGYILSSLCATVAGLMSVAQDKGVTAQTGLLSELIVIAAVVIGGASILGGRGRVLGSFLGALVIGLIDKVLREGVPITRIVEVNGEKIEVSAVSTLPAGAVPAFIGSLLIAAVLIERFVIRRQLFARLWAAIRRRPPPPDIDSGGIALVGARTTGSTASDAAMAARSAVGRFLSRRDALAILLSFVLWGAGLALRPDYWWNLSNTFAILLNYTELAILTIGLTYVIACGDIDLSVGAILALAGGTAAYCLKVLGLDPGTALLAGLLAGTLAGAINALVTVGFGLPAFIATLGMFYIARGVAAWMVAGQQLTGWPEGYNLIGRKVDDVLAYFGIGPPPGLLGDLSAVVSVQTLWMGAIAILAGLVLGRMSFGQMVYATGGNRRAADYAGIDTNWVRTRALLLCGFCAAMAGVINVAYFRSFNPAAGQFRELDAIASVIIGGGSIFGGYGTILGSLAGAAVITLVRAILQLNIVTASGASFVLPQHWVNAIIGLILIVAVLLDIWVREARLLQRLWIRFGKRATDKRDEVHA
jgi:ribose transport system permease protein